MPRTVNKTSQSDRVVEFVPADSEMAEEVGRVFLKETEKKKFKPRMVWQMMQDEGFPGFGQHQHTELWRTLEAKDEAKGYGVTMSDGQWYWYERWLDAVRQHCQENAARYQ